MPNAKLVGCGGVCSNLASSGEPPPPASHDHSGGSWALAEVDLRVNRIKSHFNCSLCNKLNSKLECALRGDANPRRVFINIKMWTILMS